MRCFPTALPPLVGKPSPRCAACTSNPNLIFTPVTARARLVVEFTTSILHSKRTLALLWFREGREIAPAVAQRRDASELGAKKYDLRRVVGP